MKKACYFLIFLFYSSLLPVEHVALKNQSLLTTTLMKLEPRHPFIVPKTTLFNTFLQPDNLFFTEIFLPYFFIPWTKYKNRMHTLLVLKPINTKMLCTSLPTIEWAVCLAQYISE